MYHTGNLLVKLRGDWKILVRMTDTTELEPAFLFADPEFASVTTKPRGDESLLVLVLLLGITDSIAYEVSTDLAVQLMSRGI